MEQVESGGRESLVIAARTLFAEGGVDAVSLREVVRCAGHRNSNAVRYHFGDRAGLLAAVVGPYELEVGARRAALVEVLAEETAPSIRSIAGALVRPSAAMLETPDGREHLRIVAELVADMDRFSEALGVGDSSLGAWDAIAKANMAETTFPLHRRYAAIALCFNELGRRSASQRRPDHRLFVSDLIDLVAGVLSADVSAETQSLLEERERQRASRRTRQTAKAST